MTPQKTPPKNADPDDETPEVDEKKEAPPKPTLLDRVLLVKLKLHTFFNTREFTIIPSVVTLIATVILISLGTWQLCRLEWKNDLLREIETNLSAAPADLRTISPQDDASWKSFDHHIVNLQGVWHWVHSFKIAPRTYEGNAGYHLYVPLQLDNGQIVVVNRGFVPDGQAVLPDEEEKVFALQGVVKIPETQRPWGSPGNDPSKGVWAWADLAAMRHEIGVNSVAPVIVYESRDAARDTYPIGGQVPAPSHNRHRQYALVWFALATALMGIWIMYSGPKPEKAKKQDETAVANDDERLKDPVARRGEYPEATD